MKTILIIILVIILYFWFSSKKEGVTFRIPANRYNAGMPVYRMSEDAIAGLKYNANTAWLPATHMQPPSFKQCMDYALSLGNGKMTDIGYTKLTECVQGNSLRPWIKNLPVQEFDLI
jgi:hypothetical protein